MNPLCFSTTICNHSLLDIKLLLRNEQKQILRIQAGNVKSRQIRSGFITSKFIRDYAKRTIKKIKLAIDELTCFTTEILGAFATPVVIFLNHTLAPKFYS